MSLSSRSTEFIRKRVAGTHMTLLNFAGIVETEAKTNATNYWKDRTSHARQSLHSGVNGVPTNLTLYLAHSMKYGVFLEEGTAPHMIKSKRHPARVFNHPGIKPRPLLQDTMKNNLPKIEKSILEWWGGDNITVLTDSSGKEKIIGSYNK